MITSNLTHLLYSGMHGSRSQCNLEGGASHTYLGNGTYTTTGRSGGSAGAERDRERERERKERGMGGLGMKDHTSYSINMNSGDDAPMSFINPMYLETPGVISRAGQRVRTGSKLARTSGIIDDSDEQIHFTNPMYEGEGYTGGSGGRGRGVGGGIRTGSKKVRSSGSGIIDDNDDTTLHFTNPMYEEEGFTGGSGGRGRGTGGGMRTGSKKVRSSGSGIIDDSDDTTLHFSNPMYEEEGFTGGSGGRGRGTGGELGTCGRKGRRSVGGDESSAGTGTGQIYDAMGRARGASLDHVDYLNPMYLTNGHGSLLGLGRGDTAALGLGAGTGVGVGVGLNQSYSKSPPSSTKKSKYVSLNDTSPLAYQRR